MSKKEERDNFWISVGPESGYLGTIAEETARKNDGGISPDGKRLGWQNACDCPPTHYQPDRTDDQNGIPICNKNDDHATDFPYGDPCDTNTTCQSKGRGSAQDKTGGKGDCDCGTGCDCANDRTDCDCGKDCDCTTTTQHHTKHPRKDCDCAPRDTCNYCTGGVLTQDNALEYGGAQVGYIPMFGADCDCGILPLPGMIPTEDIGPERQNTWENE